ncbi:MAG: sensor histidine kinase [Streptosporangiaceae bacterium]
MTRRLQATLIAAAAVLLVYYVVVNDSPWPPPDPLLYIVTAAVGLAYLAAGFAAWQRWPASRIGLLFFVVGVAWLLPAMVNLANPVAFTIGNLTEPLYGASLAHLALAWPTGRLRSRLERWLVAAEYGWTIGVSLAGTMFWNPRFSGCTAGCPANVLLVDSSRSIWQTIGTLTLPVELVLSGSVLAVIVLHWRHAQGWSRRVLVPLLWISFAVVALLTAQNVTSTFNLPVSGFLLYQVGPLVLLAGPALFIASTVRARTARGAVGAAIIDLEPGAPTGQLRDALARALGDPTLQLAFRLPDGSGYRDTGSQLVDLDKLGAGRGVTPVPGAHDAVLVHDDGLGSEPQLVRLTAAAADMALEHSRLQQEVQTQLAQVRQSRARIIEAGDAERRRLERDLHDGAQQRLVTLALALGMARNRAAGADPELAALIESASKEAREALIELRELAHGIHPAVLTETGLHGAIPALAERAPVATKIMAVPRERFPAAIEATAYFVVSEALANVAKHAGADSAQVAIRQLAGRLIVQVSDDGAGGATAENGSGLRGLADRVASVGGVMRVDSPPGAGTRLEADLPCK